MSYKAFISYSHAADGKLAPALQSALHRFAKPFYRLRALRVFRDKTSLHLTPELWPMIQVAIGQSEWFILLASPDAAQSNWVQMEAGEWLKLRGGAGERLLIVQTEGEIAWDDAASDFDWNVTTALPPNLKGAFKREPFYSDLRWARTSADLSLRNPQFLDDMGSLAAALHGKSKDEMIGNDIRQHRVFKTVAAVVGVLLLTLAIGATSAAVYANRQRQEADRQTKVAQEQQGIAERQTRAAVQAAAAEKTARQNEQRERERAVRAAENERIAAERERIARGVAEERRLQAERESRIASSRELAASAVAQFPVDPELSVMLAAEAVQRTRTAESEDALRRALLASRVRHTLQHVSWVKDAQFSGDGRWLVVDRGSSEILEVGTWKRVAEFRDRNASVSASFRPDGRTVLTHHAPFMGSDEHIVRMLENGSWRPAGEWRRKLGSGDTVTVSPDGRLLLQWSYQKAAMTALDDAGTVLWTDDAFNARQAAFSPDGKFLVTTGREDGKDVARILDAATGRPVHDLGEHVWSNAPAVFSAGGKYVAVAYVSDVARVFEMASGTAVAKLEGHTGTIAAMAFSPDGKWFVTASRDRSARVWGMATWKRAAELKGHSGSLESAAFSAGGTTLVTTSSDGSARIWDTTSWETIAVLNGHSDELLGAAVSPDGNYVATRSQDSSLRVWEVSGGRDVVAIDGSPEIGYGAFFPMPFSPDGRFVAVRNIGAKTVDVYDTKTWRKIASPATFEVLGFAPDGRSLYTIGSKGVIDRWDAHTWQKTGELKGHGGERPEILSIDFSPDGQWVATTGGYDKTTRVWDARTGETAAVLSDHEQRVMRAAFSPDGKWIATASYDNTVRITETGSWKPVAVLPASEEDLRGVTFSRDGRHLLTFGDDRQTRLWETSTWKRVATLPGEMAVFSPDARHIVTLKGLKPGLWDARTARLITPFEEWVTHAVFSADGALLVTISETAAQVRDAATGQTMFAIDVVPPGGVPGSGARKLTGAAFSADDQWLLFTCNDRITRILPRERFAPVDELLALAKTRTTRALTRDERLRYLHEAAVRGTSSGAVVRYATRDTRDRRTVTAAVGRRRSDRADAPVQPPARRGEAMASRPGGGTGLARADAGRYRVSRVRRTL